MRKKTIYVLHETGCPTHYLALDTLARRNGYRLKFNQFNFIGHFKRAIKGKDYTLLQWIDDIFMMLRFLLMKKAKVVIGIAPYNNDLRWIRLILKRHEVYYHTSYTCWDGSLYAHQPINDKIKALWKKGIANEVKHIFAVSEYTKSELIRNGFSSPYRITVVNHSFNVSIGPDTNHHKGNRFILVCVLTKHKGVDELLEYFKQHPKAHLTLVGRGQMQPIVQKYATQYPNIEYRGFIKELENTIPVYKKNSFLILNSHRTKSWEELFGMAIIEGMACGCVPITTDHHGPKEIIHHDKDGLICQEGKIWKGLDRAISMSEEEYQDMRKEAIFVGQQYSSDNMACRWDKILE